MCCCYPSSSLPSSSIPGGPARDSGWSTKRTAGTAFLFTTVVLIILACAFATGVFDKMIHISKTQIIAGSLALGAALSLIPGVILTFNPCPSIERRRSS